MDHIKLDSASKVVDEKKFLRTHRNIIAQKHLKESFKQPYKDRLEEFLNLKNQ